MKNNSKIRGKNILRRTHAWRYLRGRIESCKEGVLNQARLISELKTLAVAQHMPVDKRVLGIVSYRSLSSESDSRGGATG